MKGRTVELSRPVDKLLESMLMKVANSSSHGRRGLRPTTTQAFGMLLVSPSMISGMTTACLRSLGQPRCWKPRARPARSATKTGFLDEQASWNGHEVALSVPLVCDELVLLFVLVPVLEVVEEVSEMLSMVESWCEGENALMRMVVSAGAEACPAGTPTVPCIKVDQDSPHRRAEQQTHL